MMWGYGNNGWGWMWLVGALILVGIAVLVVILVRGVAASTKSAPTVMAPTTSKPEQILAERYARGELTTQQYRERVENLGGKTLPSEGEG